MIRGTTAASSILIAQTGFLGDVVLTTPLVAELRRRYPRAAITMLVTPAAAPLVAAHPALDRVLVDDKHGRGRGLGGALRMARTLRRHGFGLALAAHKSVRTALVLRAAGIPRRVGFARAPGAPWYTERVARPLERHDRDRILGLLDGCGGGSGATDQPWIALDEDTRRRADGLLGPLARAGWPLVGICPTSAWHTKQWPARAYGELVRELEQRGWRCVVLAAAGERPVTAAVREAAGGRGLDLTGATDVATLAGVLARMRVVVSNDSASMHIAGAVGVSQVAVFCATVPSQGYGPLGGRALVVEADLACRPCGRHGGPRCPRGTDDCMELVRVADVLRAVERAASAPARG